MYLSKMGGKPGVGVTTPPADDAAATDGAVTGDDTDTKATGGETGEDAIGGGTGWAEAAPGPAAQGPPDPAAAFAGLMSRVSAISPD